MIVARVYNQISFFPLKCPLQSLYYIEKRLKIQRGNQNPSMPEQHKDKRTSNDLQNTT